jgi:hypothetical protein
MIWAKGPPSGFIGNVRVTKICYTGVCLSETSPLYDHYKNTNARK